MSRGDVDAVLLDAAGTLIRPREPVGATYAAAARHFGVALDPEELTQAFAQVFGAMPDLAFQWQSPAELARLERDWWRTLVRSVLALLGAHIRDFDGFFEGLYGHYARGTAWECFPDAFPALDALRGPIAGPIPGRSPKLAVVSNFDSRLTGILADLGMADRLDAVVFSSLAGSAKPDPGIFHQALGRLGVAPGRALHVGDSPRADLAGAAAAGVRGLLLRRGGPPGSGSDAVIASLSELVPLLRGDAPSLGTPSVAPDGRRPDP